MVVKPLLDFQIIDAGEARWSDKINNNFNKISADTGWISAPVVEPCVGEMYYRVLNEKILLVRGGITPNQTITSDLKITDLPANIIKLDSNTPNGLWIVPITGGAAANVAKVVLKPDYGLYFAGDNGDVNRPAIINIVVMD